MEEETGSGGFGLSGRSIGGRPTGPLIIKAAFDRNSASALTRRITFPRTDRVTWNTLKDKVAQCFSIPSSRFRLAFTDDDGDDTEIHTDDDLDEAIGFFRSDPLTAESSTKSDEKVTMKVFIVVDYEGPDLSDTDGSSIWSGGRGADGGSRRGGSRNRSASGSSSSRGSETSSRKGKRSGNSRRGARGRVEDEADEDEDEDVYDFEVDLDDLEGWDDRTSSSSRQRHAGSRRSQDGWGDGRSEGWATRSEGRRGPPDPHEYSDRRNRARRGHGEDAYEFDQPRHVNPRNGMGRRGGSDNNSRYDSDLGDPSEAGGRYRRGPPSAHDSSVYSGGPQTRHDRRFLPPETDDEAKRELGRRWLEGERARLNGIAGPHIEAGRGGSAGRPEPRRRGSGDSGSFMTEQTSYPTSSYDGGSRPRTPERWRGGVSGSTVSGDSSSGSSGRHTDRGSKHSNGPGRGHRSRDRHSQHPWDYPAGPPLPPPPPPSEFSRGSHRDRSSPYTRNRAPTSSDHSSTTKSLISSLASPKVPEHLLRCKECNERLDYIRYICTICGPITGEGHEDSGGDDTRSEGSDITTVESKGAKQPIESGTVEQKSPLLEETTAEESDEPGSSYTPDASASPADPPDTHDHRSKDSSNHDDTDQVDESDADTTSESASAPSVAGSSNLSDLSESSARNVPGGFELCAKCIMTSGVVHLRTMLPGRKYIPPYAHSPPFSRSSSPEELARSSTKDKGSGDIKGNSEIRAGENGAGDGAKEGVVELRHAFGEVMKDENGDWRDIEYDQESYCSICAKGPLRVDRFRCLSCVKFELCMGCFRRVMDIHPVHAFLAIPDVRTDPSRRSPLTWVKSSAASALTVSHPDITCAACSSPIVGPRYHCVECDFVDLCSACEVSESSFTTENGIVHEARHILLKIPTPIRDPGALSRGHRYPPRDDYLVTAVLDSAGLAVPSFPDDGCHFRRRHPRFRHHYWGPPRPPPWDLAHRPPPGAPPLHGPHGHGPRGHGHHGPPPPPIFLINTGGGMTQGSAASIDVDTANRALMSGRLIETDDDATSQRTDRGTSDLLQIRPILHDAICKGCDRYIIGTRWCCANCPTHPTFDLCASCEKSAFEIHAYMHAFIRLPRNVKRPIPRLPQLLPIIYDKAADFGPQAHRPNALVHHQSVICDKCLSPIRGSWMRCLNCVPSYDLCAACLAVDQHDATHAFIKFDRPVDLPLFKELTGLATEQPSPLINFTFY